MVQPKLTCSRDHHSRLLVCSNSRTIVLPEAAGYRRLKKPAAGINSAARGGEWAG